MKMTIPHPAGIPAGLILILLLGTECVSEAGTNTNSNAMATSYSLRKIEAELARPPGPYARWWQLFAWRVECNAPYTQAQFFDPLTHCVKWTRLELNSGYGREEMQSAGEDAALDIIGDSMIDVIESIFDFDSLQSSARPEVINVGARFAQGSLDSSESGLEFDTIEPNSDATVRERLSRFATQDTKYGANILNPDPYLHYAKAFKDKQNRVRALMSTRMHALAASSRRGNLRSTSELRMFLDEQTQVFAGYQFYPTKFGGDPRSEADDLPGTFDASYTFGFSHKFGIAADSDIIYGSIRIRPDGNYEGAVMLSLNKLLKWRRH